MEGENKGVRQTGQLSDGAVSDSAEDKASLEERAKRASERIKSIVSNREKSEPAVASEQSDGAPNEEIENLMQAGADSRRGELSAVTVGRMLGLVTAGEIQVLEKKLDLLVVRVNNLLMKVDKLSGALGSVATGAELERLEVQLGAVRSAIKEIAAKQASAQEQSGEGDQLSKTKIQSNQPQTFGGKVIRRIDPKDTPKKEG